MNKQYDERNPLQTEDIFVRCIDCKNFDDANLACKYEEECDIWDFEIPRKLKYRPKYEEIN